MKSVLARQLFRWVRRISSAKEMTKIAGSMWSCCSRATCTVDDDRYRQHRGVVAASVSEWEDGRATWRARNHSLTLAATLEFSTRRPLTPSGERIPQTRYDRSR